MDEYSIDPNVARELQLPSYKEKIALHKKYLYMVMHFPVLRHSNNGNSEQEIDFIVSKNFIITTRYETIDALEKFTKLFEVNAILEKGIMEDHAGYVLYYIIKELYRSVSDELDSINDRLKKIEKEIFEGREKAMVYEISKSNRNLISIDHALRTHKEILDSLEDVAAEAFNMAFHENTIKISNDYYKVENMLLNNIDFLKELRETNDSLLSTKQNETMKTLTVITFLVMPFTVVTSFFQMNTSSTPLIGTPNDWQIIVISEVILAIALFTFARFKKWF
jgi:Mg2+ and Co2+ transporter CorA